MEYQSIEYNKITNVYYGSNCYNCFAMHMSIDNNQSLILLIMIYERFSNRKSLFYKN